jgi:predicted nucleic acid-binding protein
LIIDASVWVSRVIASDVNHEASQRWLTRYMSRGETIVLPATATVEIAGAVSRRTHDDALAVSATAEVLSNPMVDVVEISRELASYCVNVAARLRLRGMDAIYVAIAERTGLALVTWDDDVLTRASAAIQVTRPS